MLPGMSQVPGKGQVVLQLWGRQRLGRPRGVVPTRTLLACARVAERSRRAALTSAPSWSPVSMEEMQMFLAPGVLVQPREWHELMQEEVMVG